MKKIDQIQELDYNDLAFFTDLSPSDCKWEIAAKLGKTDFTLSGIPIIGKEDTIKPWHYNFTIRSNSKLDGKNKMEYLVKYYNKGTHTHQLMEFSQNETFIKALEFTGKYKILNDILNNKQYLKLQKSWLRSHILLTNNYVSAKAQKFMKQHSWARKYLKEQSITLKYLKNDKK